MFELRTADTQDLICRCSGLHKAKRVATFRAPMYPAGIEIVDEHGVVVASAVFTPTG